MLSRIIVNHPTGFEHDPLIPDFMCTDQWNFVVDAIDVGFANYPGGVWGLQDRERGIDPKTGQIYHTGERYDGDNTCKLYKDDIVIWVVCRDINQFRHENYKAIWFENGTHSAPANLIPNKFSLKVIESLRDICTHCEQHKPGELKPISFAGRVCRTCDTPTLRAKMEPPGWTN